MNLEDENMTTLVERAVKIAMREDFDDAVAILKEEKEDYLKVANSKVDSLVEEHDRIITVFLAKDNRLLFISAENPTDQMLEQRIKKAAKEIAGIRPKKDYNGIANGRKHYGADRGTYREFATIDADFLSDMANGMIAGAEDGGALATAGTLYLNAYTTEFCTSGGYSGRSSSAHMRVSIRCFGRISSFQDFAVLKSARNLDLQAFGKKAAEMSNMVKKKGKAEAGRYDIIYMPSPAGSLLSNINSMACMGNIETGSPLSGKLNKRVGNPGLTILDSGNFAESVDYRAYDDEGMKTSTTEVIRDGVLRNYLHNFSTAKKYRTRSTGNAGLVEPEPGTPIIKHRNSTKNLDALIGEVKKGILITNTWYTRFSNYLTGDFSTVPRDLSVMIRDGEPEFAIRHGGASSMVGIRISENVLRMAKSSSLAGGKPVQTTSWDSEGDYCFCPPMLVEGVSVTTL